MKIVGTIRKWVQTWGTCNVYQNGALAPQKYFVHVSKRVDKTAVLGMGTRISFVEGPARSEGELPMALEIEVVSQPPSGTSEGGNNDSAK